MTENTQTVRELLADRVDGTIESVVWYKSNGSARYALVGSTTDDGRAWLSTAVLDVEDDTLRVLDNSMWLPAEGEILDAAIRSLARTTNAATDALDDSEGSMRDSLLDFSADEFDDYELVDDYDPSGDSPWQENEGPSEMYDVRERLAESPIETPDRLIMLEFGGKAPWTGFGTRELHAPEEIGGNYGVEVTEDDDLVIVDVDDVEAADLDDLPETLRSESPHGGYHLFLHVPGWREAFRERFDVENPHPPWGEIRSQDGYVVGPGCRLTDCKHEDCCTEDDPGEYVMTDREIATVDADVLADVLADARGESA